MIVIANVVSAGVFDNTATNPDVLDNSNDNQEDNQDNQDSIYDETLEGGVVVGIDPSAGTVIAHSLNDLYDLGRVFERVVSVGKFYERESSHAPVNTSVVPSIYGFPDLSAIYDDSGSNTRAFDVSSIPSGWGTLERKVSKRHYEIGHRFQQANNLAFGGLKNTVGGPGFIKSLLGGFIQDLEYLSQSEGQANPYKMGVRLGALLTTSIRSTNNLHRLVELEDSELLIIQDSLVSLYTFFGTYESGDWMNLDVAIARNQSGDEYGIEILKFIVDLLGESFFSLLSSIDVEFVSSEADIVAKVNSFNFGTQSEPNQFFGLYIPTFMCRGIEQTMFGEFLATGPQSGGNGDDVYAATTNSIYHEDAFPIFRLSPLVCNSSVRVNRQLDIPYLGIDGSVHVNTSSMGIVELMVPEMVILRDRFLNMINGNLEQDEAFKEYFVKGIPLMLSRAWFQWEESHNVGEATIQLVSEDYEGFSNCVSVLRKHPTKGFEDLMSHIPDRGVFSADDIFKINSSFEGAIPNKDKSFSIIGVEDAVDLAVLVAVTIGAFAPVNYGGVVMMRTAESLSVHPKLIANNFAFSKASVDSQFSGPNKQLLFKIS